MPQMFLPGEVLAIAAQAADRLLALDSGDAALLYLQLLRRGGTQGLRWPEDRLGAALDQLRAQGLAPGELPAPPEPPAPEVPPPEYSTEDISQALADRASTFPVLVDEVEADILNRGEKEINSRIIGELVMNKLKDLDAVAYVRFASVYREFKDINTFMDELKKVLDK